MFKKLFFLIIPFLSVTLNASDLKLSNPILFVEDNTHYAVFNLEWNNAWHSNKNHDGVWLFFKSLPREGQRVYKHINVSNQEHSVISNFKEDNLLLGFKTPKDGVGLFVYPKSNFRGNVHVSIKIVLDSRSFEGINTRNSALKVYGIEMVNIPEGKFKVGSPDKTAISFGGLYKPDKNGGLQNLIAINSEEQKLKVSINGDIYYQAPEGYEGDQTGTIPSSFPKGVNSFYIMKYEPTEGQYIDFLNSLTPNQKTNRLIFKVENYYNQGGAIIEKNGEFSTPFPNKPCQFMSWDDAMAYADWAGLRPMTEFEYVKAARGTVTPIRSDFPWGTDSKDIIQRRHNNNWELTMINGWDESNLEDTTKAYFGASYYWVMDLSGSMWERVITIGHPNGRKFVGLHGDGILSDNGNATTQNWPTGQENSGGIGFRGGGFYGYDREYHNYNPYSPIAFRPYGGWHGGMRSIAYGTRFVRTLD